MKTKLQNCSTCNEETVHDVGKKQGTNKSGAYMRRRTSRCRECGKREIENIKKRNKVTIPGKNKILEKLTNGTK